MAGDVLQLLSPSSPCTSALLPFTHDTAGGIAFGHCSQPGECHPPVLALQKQGGVQEKRMERGKLPEQASGGRGGAEGRRLNLLLQAALQTRRRFCPPRCQLGYAGRSQAPRPAPHTLPGARPAAPGWEPSASEEGDGRHPQRGEQLGELSVSAVPLWQRCGREIAQHWFDLRSERSLSPFSAFHFCLWR